MVSPDQPRFGSSAEEQKLPAKELAAEANRLIGELKQALSKSSSFHEAAGQYLLEHSDQTRPSLINFTKSGIPYSFYIWPDEYDKRLLVASKGKSGEEYTGIHLDYYNRGFGIPKPSAIISCTRGKEHYYDSRQAIQMAEVFIRELQVAL